MLLLSLLKMLIIVALFMTHDKSIWENVGTLKFVPECYKTQKNVR